MRAYRDEAPVSVTDDRRGIVVIAVIAAVVVFGTLLYWGLRDTTESASEDPLQVVRDVEAVAAPSLNTVGVEPPVVQETAADAGDFSERQLGPPRTTVGAGEAPVANQGEDEATLVIDGELLEELEADAEAATATP